MYIHTSSRERRESIVPGVYFIKCYYGTRLKLCERESKPGFLLRPFPSLFPHFVILILREEKKAEPAIFYFGSLMSDIPLLSVSTLLSEKWNLGQYYSYIHK
jgi:hypothetical protein